MSSHLNTPASVLNAPKPTVLTLTAAEISQPSERRRMVLVRRAAKAAKK